MKRRITKTIITIVALVTFIGASYFLAGAVSLDSKVNVRIKDLATIQGTNNNQLIGYGLVTGLKNTGDRTKTLSSAMIKNTLENMGLKMDPIEMSRLQTKNTAMVMVTADLPASFRSGDNIDVTISSVGDATSIEGGVLLLSTLRGPDGKVYASAQGPISVGLDPNDPQGRKKYVVGRIPGGGIICKNMDAELVRGGKMTWVLRYPDYNTVSRVVEAINRHYRRDVAKSGGDRFVYIDYDPSMGDPTLLAAQIGTLQVMPDMRARVVINERTGTVIMGSDVKISPVAISHGSLTLRVDKSSSKTAAAAQKQPNASAPDGNRVLTLGGDATIRDVIDVLNFIGTTPKDLITILQALKNAGALQGELEIQ